MKAIINDKDYYSKVYGGWMGKNIGGTLGGPVEGHKELMNLTFYPVLSDAPMPNDDLDLQLVWLHALEQYGTRITAKQLGEEWVEHVFFPYDEYGVALTNLRRGLVPPISGWFNNPFTNCMGSPIRSEIWAMSAPGAPGVAAYYAYQDAIVDHAGGEGVYGEVFFASIESAAFFESDVNRLLDIGLKFIPDNCRTAMAIKDLRKWHGEGKNWLETRELILKYHSRENFTDAPQNIAFTILGWLYGEDFGDAILKAVNCGYDTDCTGATLGAILGIIGGKDSIPEKWSKPVGEKVAVSAPVKGFDAPKDLEELAARTLKIGREVMAVWNVPIDITSEMNTFVPQGAFNDKGQIKGDYDPSWLWEYSFNTDNYLLPFGTFTNKGLEVVIDYGSEGPSIGVKQSKEIIFKITNNSYETWEGRLEIILPEGFDIIPKDSKVTSEHIKVESKNHQSTDQKAFQLTPGSDLEWKVVVKSAELKKSYYDFKLCIHREHDDNLWNTNSLNFVLVTSAQWKLSNSRGEVKYVNCPGNRIAFDKAFSTIKGESYYASTTLFNPKEKKVNLIAAAKGAVKVSIDGKVIINDENITDFMPAYHRAVESKKAVITLPEGNHLLEVEAMKYDENFDVYILPVATWETKKPGSFYYYTDVMFL